MAKVLNTKRMRVVKVNDKGRVIKRKKFVHGDIVTEDDLKHIEGRYESLVASGALVDEGSEVTYDEPDPEDVEELASLGVTVNEDNTVTLSVDTLKAVVEKAVASALGEDADGDADADSDEVVDPGYEDWDYPVLLSALEERNSERDPENQIEPESKSKAHVAAALRADDAAHADDE